MNKITQVAVAISGNQFPSKYSFHKARLAIEAMRDPTDMMVSVGTGECDFDEWVKPIYQAMIDAALEEEWKT